MVQRKYCFFHHFWGKKWFNEISGSTKIIHTYNRCQILGGSLREDILLEFEEDFLSAGFRPRTLVADGSSRARWKAGDLLLKFKKNPDEKYFFIMEKFDFEKIFWKYF